MGVGEFENGRCVVQVLGRHERGVASVAVSPDGQHVASRDWDGSIKLWAMNDESEINSALPENSGHLTCKHCYEDKEFRLLDNTYKTTS